jgi:hypothetical protein
MNFRFKFSVLFLYIASISIFVAACGGVNDSKAVAEPTSAATSSASPPESSSVATNDAPVSDSIDGTFVVNNSSEATFTVNEKLSRLPLPNDAVLRTNAITGEIDLASESASLVIDLHALESDDSRRDRYVRDRLFPTQSTTTISINRFPDIPETFATGEAFTSTVIGTVNVNGAEAEIEFTLESRLDPDRLLILVKGDFLWDDFGMPAPTSNFFVVKDEVHVEVLVSAVPK